MATTPAREAAAWLSASREAVLRRALVLAVERATLAELAERPLGGLVRELELVIDAARIEAGGEGEPPDPLVEALAPRVAGGGPVALALLAAPAGSDGEAWARALADAADGGERVLALGGGLVAAIAAVASRAEARAAVDRLRATAWVRLGGAGSLPDAGIAVFPDDGDEPRALIDRAREALGEARPADVPDAADHHAAPAPDHHAALATDPHAARAADPAADSGRREAALRRALARWAREDGADREPPPVTPLHPL